MRAIHIDNKIYEYEVGKNATRINLPNGQRVVVANHELKGVTPDTFERGQWKRTSDGALTLAEVKAYILREIHNKTQPYFTEVSDNSA